MEKLDEDLTPEEKELEYQKYLQPATTGKFITIFYTISVNVDTNSNYDHYYFIDNELSIQAPEIEGSSSFKTPEGWKPTVYKRAIFSNFLPPRHMIYAVQNPEIQAEEGVGEPVFGPEEEKEQDKDKKEGSKPTHKKIQKDQFPPPKSARLRTRHRNPKFGISRRRVISK